MKKDKNILLDSLEKIIKKNIIKYETFGLLFSGGVDSLLLAIILKKLNLKFKCYFGYVKGFGEPKDLMFAKEISKKLNLNLEITSIELKDVKNILNKIIPLINSDNPIQVGVALPIYLSCKKAKEQGIKNIFSGAGADELFCGYNKFKKIKDVTKKSIELLSEIKKKDIIRDTKIAKENNLRLIIPYLDKKIVDFALSLKRSQKLNDKQNKIPIRKLLSKLGVEEKFFNRKKVAAQYGSNFDKALKKLAKQDGYKYKSEFLKSFSHKKIVVLYSGGKDSNLALWLMQKKNYKISCLLSMIPKNENSYMYQKPNIEFLKLQSQALDIPLIIKRTKGEKEKELKELKDGLKDAKEKYDVKGVVSGALFSNYQKERINKICEKLNLKLYSPLWHMEQEKELSELNKNKFKYIICKIAAYGLDESWLGKIIEKKDIIKLRKLNKKIKFNVAGEGGEFESLILDAPMFKKKITILKSIKKMENEFTGILQIKDFKLEEKSIP